MKVRLEVLAATSIKRRNPWSRIVWLGKERESLILLDKKKVSVLYVPSGKTKRNIPKLTNLLLETVFLTPSPGGSYLVGVQTSGEVFVWHKDQDDLKTVCGLANLLLNSNVTPSDGCMAFTSQDCSQILLVLGSHHLYLWQKEAGTMDPKSNILLGKWSKVVVPAKIVLPPLENKEVSMQCVYTSSEMLGECCQLSIVFNLRGNLILNTLFLHFNTDDLTGLPSEGDVDAASTWSCLQYPIKNIQTGCEAMNMSGAYVTSYTNDGQVLAVGVNQKSPAQTSVLFVSPFTDTVLVSEMRGCGVKDPQTKRGRQYWISSMVWTSDSLFLAVMLRNGCAGLLSRLGEPIAILSKGCSIDMGPAYFLPLTPLITVQSDRPGDGKDGEFPVSINSELDPMHQRFSVSSHPTLPILLFSDGFTVVIIQLPSELSPVIFMRDLVLESSAHLRQIAETHRLDLTLANAYNLPSGDLETMKQSPRGFKYVKNKMTVPYSFEEPSMSLNETLDSEVSFALGEDSSAVARTGAVQNSNSGKIIFGEPDYLQVTDFRSYLNEPNSSMKALHLARINLFNVWKLAATNSETWSTNLDKIVTHMVHNVVKLFSLVLDCPQIKELLDAASGGRNEPAVQTASLFKVITMYRQLLDLVQFDCKSQHLVASVVQLTHKTLQAVLSSIGLTQSDPRVKTLTGCFTLLKFTEKTLQNVYVTLPLSLQNKGMTLTASLGSGELKRNIGPSERMESEAQLAKRLVPAWKLLYKSVSQYLVSQDASASDCRQAQTLQSAIQQCLIQMGVQLPQVPHAGGVNQGEKFSLDGKHTMAMNAWKEQLMRFQEAGNVKNAGRLFHSILYTYILRNDLTAAVAFVDHLIVTAKSSDVENIDPDQSSKGRNLQPSLLTFVTGTLKSQAFHEQDMVPCIRDRAIRQVVQTLARFMASYFSNQPVFIFPPHNPTPLPAVHYETSISNSHIIPKYHEDLAAIVRHQKLGSIWTVERTLEYLLLSGLVCEGIWFADRMGDWKSAYQLSVAHLLHRRIAAKVYASPKKPLTVPDWLKPDAIMKRRMEKLLKDDLSIGIDNSDLSQMTKVLEDIALAGVMGFVELGTWMLESLVTRLSEVVKQMSPLVPKDFYLPAPPLYCAQPPREQIRYSMEAEDEIRLRQRASSLIQLILCVMNATHLSIPSVTWYVQMLEKVQLKATQFKVNIEGPCLDLPDDLYQYMQLESEFSQVDIADVQPILISFRDFCSLLWLTEVRDKLSIHLREREKFLNWGVDVEDGEQWLRKCFVTLQWAIHLVAFSRFLSDEANVYKVVLSLLLDLPATEETANILAEHVYDTNNLHPEVQERLERLLTSWQGIILVPEADGKSVGDSLEFDEEGRKSVTFLGASPRGKSLSSYFHKQCLIMDKVLKKKSKCFGSYEEFVFNSVTQKSGHKSKLDIGSRPFESKGFYLEFLNTFFSVSFSKVLDAMEGKDKMCGMPFLRVFARDIVDREMAVFVQRVSSTAHKKQMGLSVLSGAAQSHQAQAGRGEQERASTSGRRTRSQERDEVPGRSSGRVRRQQSEGDGRPKGAKPVGLFRGKSTWDASLERQHATVRRFESEPGLDDMDNFSLSEFTAADSHGTRRGSQPNISGMASRFSQSEDSLYHGTGNKGLHDWSLMVTFGKKYTALQQLVEWLEVWGNKSHSLGQGQEFLEIMPKMRIHIPAQLIILSLWLLENKYNRSAQEEVKAQRVSRGRRARRLSHSPKGKRKQSQSPGGRSQGSLGRGRSGTPPMPPEPPLYPQSAINRMSQHAPKINQVTGSEQRSQPGSRHTSPPNQDPLQRSMQQSTLDQEEIIDAYTQFLDGPEDSSSIGVSSLASDELDGDLKNTLNAIRGTSPIKDSSTLNHTIFPKDESPDRAKAQLSPPKGSSTPVGKQHAAGRRTPSVSPPPQSRKSGREDSASQHLSQQQLQQLQQQQQQLQSQAGSIHLSQQGNGADLASQLQAVIRDELRRIMEVQHRSVLAMMGALDTVAMPAASPQIAPGALNNITNNKEISASQASRSHKQSSSHKKRPRPQVGDSPTRAVVTAWSDDDTTIKSITLQEDLMSQSSMKAKRRAARKEGHMRETLAELQNLQQQSTKFPHPGGRKLHQQSYSEDFSVSQKGSRYPGPPSHNEENVRLPYMAFQAWTEQGAPPPGNQNIQRLPLLHIDRPEQQQPLDPFKNLRKFLPQVPTPQPFYPPHFHQSQPPYFQAPPTQPPQQPVQDFSFSSFYQSKSQSVSQRMPPPPYEQRPLPLLSVAPPQTNQVGGISSGFPLLKFLPPGISYGEQDTNRTRLEETRQRLLNQFNAQLRKDKENVMKQEHQFLQFEKRGDLRRSMEDLRRSMESVASKASEKEVSEKTKTIAEEGEKAEVQEEEQAEARAAEQSEMPQSADAATSDTQINDGFALPRGIFDSYLQLGENLFGPEVNQTNAALHMQLAEAMHRHAAKRVRAKVDFSTMTQEQIDAGVDAEEVRTAEAATSITKDTGSDPIQEALDEHRRHNNLIPPDIFMGLRFTDQDSQSGVDAATPSADVSRGRAFLNVADIRASTILKDIPERDKKPDHLDADQMDTAILASSKTAQQIGAMEETLREKFAPRERQPLGYDSVTVRMFDQLKSRDDSVSVAVMPRSSMTEPKSAMIRRLRDMSDQIRAIDEMSQNIERDFKSSHLLLNTIQDVNESIQTSRSVSPEPRRRDRKKKEISYSLEEQSEEDRRSPSHVPTPKTSHRSPQMSARSTKSRSSAASGSAGDMSQDELTDLIEEVLNKEGLDAAEISQEISEQLERYARDHLHSDRRSEKQSPRKQFMSPRKEGEKGKRTEKERERLKAWMMEKFHKRHEEYRKRRQENIEREPHPFKSQTSAAVSHLDLKNLESEIKEKRKMMMAEFMDQRLAEAENLLGSILVEKPEFPWVEGEEAKESARRDLSRSPRHGRSTTMTVSPTRSAMSRDRKSRSPTRKGGSVLSERQLTASRSPRDRQLTRSSDGSPVKGILKTSSMQDFHPTGSNIGGMGDNRVLASISEGMHTGESSMDLTNYARAILERDGELSSVASMDFGAHPRSTQGQRSVSPQSTAAQSRASGASRAKMLSDLVRMQRPEVTRKWKEVNLLRKAHEESLASARDSQRSKTTDPNMQKEKQKVYGSKKIPGSSPRATIPRRVKTYAERLQDMRGLGGMGLRPPSSRPGSGRTVSSATFRTASSGKKIPPHKPQTYVQQLQGLRSQGSARSAGGRKIPVAGRTFMRSHGPLHKPKTYTERLQDLNPHHHPQHDTSFPTMSTRTQVRSRPYKDPYMDMNTTEFSLAMSDRDIDEYARNIIYGGGSTAASSAGFMVDEFDLSLSNHDHGRVAPSEGQSDYYEAIMGGGRATPHRLMRDEDYGPDDYRASVDIHEIERIADDASVASGSILSVIDWDEIQNIIKDEQT